MDLGEVIDEGARTLLQFSIAVLASDKDEISCLSHFFLLLTRAEPEIDFVAKILDSFTSRIDSKA
ncbi:hypothetical protein SFA35_20380 [Pseudomonas sp. HR96]|uniref:hypothetical protein n=1 Tax=Pseudomonas sp. HR96 TaxID=1027966 RepID=UPI002A74B100|nr:hypothetical protein [Pseudomonas sp. HR96]WPO98946.1 hypothetical protein SFA35_20380 [Pseudomonas sp. HR96]